MEINELLDTIPDEGLRAQFRTFINSGDATEEFLTLLDGTPEYQQIVDAAFEAQAQRLERFATRIREMEPTSPTGAGMPGMLPTEFARTVAEAAALASDDLDRFTEKTVNAVPPSQRQRVNSLVSKLSAALAAG